MEIIKSDTIPDVIKIIPTIYSDERGSFAELYNIEKYDFVDGIFVQDNVSYSSQNVLRGLHYQLFPYSQSKLVTCISGLVLDVAVDLRVNSPTLGKWTAFKLNGAKSEQVWIPSGFAHGFYSLNYNASISYKVTSVYNPENERTLIWNDPSLGIRWTDYGKIYPLLSEKDKKGISFQEAMKEISPELLTN